MEPAKLRDAAVLVAGAGISGRAAAAALLDLGARVIVTDADPSALTDLPDGAEPRPGETLPEEVTLVVTGPGRRPDHPLVRQATAAGVPVVGEPELAWWIGQAAPEPPTWLVVTGTNGKTTTTGMLAAILEAAGMDAVACGNIGHPVVDAVRAGHRVLAVELSSFQLYWSPSIRPAAGCLLNLAEDHLDWHGSMSAYADAKARALTGPVAVASVDDPAAARLLAAAPAARRIGVTLRPPGPDQLGIVDGVLVDRAFGGGELIAASAVPPDTPPGLTDALAAAALARAAGASPEAVQAGLAAFRPGAHRAQLVAEVDGVRYVDDSKATNPHAAAASLAAHQDHPIVWIVGGVFKGASVDELVARHADLLRAAVVIGTDRVTILDALARHAPKVPVVEVDTGNDGAVPEPLPASSSSAERRPPDPMRAAVRHAARLALPGDVVLLAPAAASMDQFTDYAHRGRAFAAAVAELATTRSR